MRKFADIGMSGAVFLLSVCFVAPVVAENFADPTRPPDARDGMMVGPVLQSVLIAPGRAEAIISGRTVKVGEKFGDAQVVKIAETEVVLRSAKDVQTLKLFPNIEKRMTYNPVGGSTGKREIEKK